MSYVDYYLNRITMYKLVAFSLSILAIISIIFGYSGALTISGNALLLSFVVISAACFGARVFFSKLFKVTMNDESSLITALILFLILPPSSQADQLVVSALVGVLAIASKFILAVHRKHIFNPAAIAVVIAGLLGLTQASWWIANDVMFIFIILAGLLILRKTNRYRMFFIFAGFALGITLLQDFSSSESLVTLLKTSLVSFPIIFLGTVMLTEPSTTPPNQRLQLIYAAIVGVLVGLRLNVGDFYVTPEIALVIGNIFAYSSHASMRKRYKLVLESITELAPEIHMFTFKPDAKIRYEAGQYIELTAAVKTPDIRGNRRTFTIASAPAEDSVSFVIRVPRKTSAFKKALINLKSDDSVYAQHVAGDFTLPQDNEQKLLFIAGGIGITPFMSIIKFIVNTKTKHDIVLLYQASDKSHFIQSRLFKAAENCGVKTIRVTAPLAKDELEAIEDIRNRLVYISGPDGFVKMYRSIFDNHNITSSGIKTDYFTGY